MGVQIRDVHIFTVKNTLQTYINNRDLETLKRHKKL